MPFCKILVMYVCGPKIMYSCTEWSKKVSGHKVFIIIGDVGSVLAGVWWRGMRGVRCASR